MKNNSHYYVFCDAHETLLNAMPTIKTLIEEKGFCVISAWDNSVETLKTVSALFGNAQLHVRSDADGIVGNEQCINTTWQSYKEEYRGITNDEFHPHTDGSFVHGMLPMGDKAVRVNPPKMLLLQCVKQADDGGTNVLVDSQPIFADLKRFQPDMLKALSTPGCVTFCRDDQLALDVPVYHKITSKLYHIRFRYDAATYTPSWSQDAVYKLHHHYHLNDQYRIKIDLHENDILIVDNLRVLHGREAFKKVEKESETRKLRRVWIGVEDEKLFNVEHYYREQRAVLPYKYYKVLDQAPQCPLAQIKLGITTN